MSKKPVFRLFF